MSLSFSYDKEGIFKTEIKNRFRANVVVDGKEEICYIQSSSRLENYVDLKNKKIFLRHIDSNHLSYTVFAKYKKYDYMLLCPKIANDIIFSEINRRMFSYLGFRKDAIKEHTINGYKSDIYLKKERTIVEIKSHLSEKDNNSLFPTVYSERTLNQLDMFDKLIELGYNIVFLICSFNPYTSNIIINKSSRFYIKILRLIDKGLKLKAYSITCKKGQISIKREIKIEI